MIMICELKNVLNESGYNAQDIQINEFTRLFPKNNDNNITAGGHEEKNSEENERSYQISFSVDPILENESDNNNIKENQHENNMLEMINLAVPISRSKSDEVSNTQNDEGEDTQNDFENIDEETSVKL